MQKINYKFLLKILLAITATSQLITPSIFQFSGGANFSVLLITPAGYTFALWGVITLLSTVFAIYHLFQNKYFSNKFYLSLSFVYICFSTWLYFAEKEFLLTTLFIFVLMYLALIKVFKEVLEFKTEKISANNNSNNYGNSDYLFEKYTLQSGVGLYLGWSTVALIANLGVVIFSFGLEKYSTLGQTAQILLIILAALNSIFILLKFNKNIFLFITFWWAFVGILVGLFGRAETNVLIIVTLICVVILNYFYFKKL